MLEDYLNRITVGDCLKHLAYIPDDSIDMAFADPPFNLGKKYNGGRDRWEDTIYQEWCKEWLMQLVRVTKPTGSIFVHNIPKWLTFFAGVLDSVADFKHWIAWDAPTAPMGKSLQPGHYGILYYARSRPQNKFYEVRYRHKRCRRCHYLLKDYGGKKDTLHPFGPLLSDVWTDIHRIKHSKYRDDHPCQLPIHLMERLILMSTDAGEVVLDPFMGTGTTALAAKRLGRHFIGIEQDETYALAAETKLKQESSQTRIGEAWASFFMGDVVTIRDIDWPEISCYYNLPSQMKEIDHTAAAVRT